MTGGLMQLVAYGRQSIYHSSNPQMSFFKKTYKKHTNYSKEQIQLKHRNAAGGNTMKFGTQYKIDIPRIGDLAQEMHFRLKMTGEPGTDKIQAGRGGCYSLGNAMIKNVEIEIGGQMIDRHYGEWLTIWSELTLPEGKRQGYDEMVGNCMNPDDIKSTLYVPLQFWFNRNPAAAIPLISLQWHEVIINVKFRDANELFSIAPPDDYEITFWTDYIYLDTEERLWFSQNPHEYLIEKLGFTGDKELEDTQTMPNNMQKIALNYYHCCKALYWVAQDNITTGSQVGQPCMFTPLHYNMDNSIKTNKAETNIQINDHNRFEPMEMDYFIRQQIYQHHSNKPRSVNNQFMYMYSYCLEPENPYPTGNCDFERIDSIRLIIKNMKLNPSAPNNKYTLKVFPVMYNVLRVMSGMAGLAF